MRKKVSLSKIEDNKHLQPQIAEVAKSAVKKAIDRAKSKSIDITYLKNNEIVTESPSGEITVIGTVVNNRRKVIVGSQDTLT